MHLASDAALEIERHVVVACDYRLELQERIGSRCGKAPAPNTNETKSFFITEKD